MNSSQISPSTPQKKHLSRDQSLLVSSRLKNHESVLVVSMQPWLSVMQDNAPPHSAAKTMEEMEERAIAPISWPPKSPDLNPIEAVWDSMKEYIQFNYPSLGGGKKRCQVKLRLVVKEAWDSMPSEYFVKLIETMPSRCQVIAADGGPTKY
ncbi:hypothetical protein EPUL_000937 [Erysiphe pulchra]|uniref:Tc1-like transposase DDE domain-containing protein n=1 Tax=Erysiphe pulchra TaxID=225359 RepID=A0A2S4PV89_9PEZI|nr:hypothetical protein EPUL_000937 [Erysiphe pulchra]